LLLSYCRHHGAYEGMVLCYTIPAHVQELYSIKPFQ
jgi:hypothetical protein